MIAMKGYWMEGDSLAPPCQADIDIVDAILAFASPKPIDTLYDLGCGDGRICIRASQIYGCKSVGCEIEDHLVRKFRSKVESLQIQDKVSVVHGDLLQLDLSSATIITLYLLPDAIVLLTPLLIKALLSGTIVVCNTWGPKTLNPVDKIVCGVYNNVTIFKYDHTSIPENLLNPNKI